MFGIGKRQPRVTSEAAIPSESVGLVREDGVLLSDVGCIRSQQLVTVQRTADQFVTQARSIPPETSDPRSRTEVLIGRGAFDITPDRRAQLIILSLVVPCADTCGLSALALTGYVVHHHPKRSLEWQ